MKRLFVFFAVLLACACSQAQVTQYKLKVVKDYPHDMAAYTQGLFFHDGTLYETTGQYGASSIRKVDLQSGRPIENKKLNAKYFAEGSVILGDDLYILTWTNKVAFRYDAKTLSYKSTVSYPREGWGLTTDGKNLIASNGSSRLYFMDGNFKVLRTVDVRLDGRAMRYLNELEWIDGKIWANVYTSDLILIIDPDSGDVEATVDCSGLLPRKLRTSTTDVLNGIAQDPATGKIYLTGKYWPRLYEISLTEIK